MKQELIPTSWPRVAILSALFVVPAFLAVRATINEPSTALEDWVLIGVVALCVGLAVAVPAAFVFRRHIILTADALVVRHSFYTLTLIRTEAAGADITELPRKRDLKLSLKKNGVALHGLYSGWFYGAKGELLFCAVSSFPAYEMRLSRESRCRGLVISASPRMIEEIRAWAAR